MRFRSFLTAAAVAASAIVSVQTGSLVVEAATVQPGFTDSPVGSFSRPTAVEWLPGNRIVVLEQGGRIRVGRPGTGFTTAIDLDVCSNSERGLLGLAPDPAFLSNGWVYVYYTDNGPNGCVNRLSRFTMLGDSISSTSELVLVDNIASTGGNHNGGDVEVGSDGFLYVGVGDAGADPRGDSGGGGSNDAAQDLSLLNGKILRLTRLGAPAPGNPFSGAGTIRCGSLGTGAPLGARCQEIYSWGLRNPYRIAIDRNDGSDRFFINDVGQNTYEEVNQGAAGNFGWPTREGPCQQGATRPCAGAPAGLIDPLTSYGRGEGSYVTGGAFTPDGLWAERFDGTYFFSDGGSGQMWIRQPNGSVDYDAPFATGAFGITDMTFGFDAGGEMVLYYVQVGGSLRMISETDQAAPAAPSDLRMLPINPIRAYDTGDGTGVPGGATGPVFNATTRVVDLDPPGAYPAALVNITAAATAGSGFVRTWESRAPRPATSSVNADGSTTVGNAVIVPLADDGTFVLETATTTRVVVDVMAWFAPTGGTSDDGRLIALPPARLADTRETAGTLLDSGSTNPWSRSGNRIDLDVAGFVGVPDDATVQAVVLSVAAIARPAQQGRVTLVPRGAPDSGTASVNVTGGDIRNNVVVVPLDRGAVSAITKNLDDIVVDVLGYVTSTSAVEGSAGLYSPIAATRVVDTRIPRGIGRLAPTTPALVAVPGGQGASAVAQTITVTNTSGPGWIVAHPSVDPPVVSNLNYRAAGQTRGTLAFTQLTDAGGERFTARVATDVVVDVVGFFSD